MALRDGRCRGPSAVMRGYAANVGLRLEMQLDTVEFALKRGAVQLGPVLVLI